MICKKNESQVFQGQVYKHLYVVFLDLACSFHHLLAREDLTVDLKKPNGWQSHKTDGTFITDSPQGTNLFFDHYTQMDLKKGENEFLLC